jgi:hypothetical protein
MLFGPDLFVYTFTLYRRGFLILFIHSFMLFAFSIKFYAHIWRARADQQTIQFYYLQKGLNELTSEINETNADIWLLCGWRCVIKKKDYNSHFDSFLCSFSNYSYLLECLRNIHLKIIIWEKNLEKISCNEVPREEKTFASNKILCLKLELKI